MYGSCVLFFFVVVVLLLFRCCKGCIKVCILVCLDADTDRKKTTKREKEGPRCKKKKKAVLAYCLLLTGCSLKYKTEMVRRKCESVSEMCVQKTRLL